VNDAAEEGMIAIHELEAGRFARIRPLLDAYLHEIGEAPQDEDGASRIQEAIRNDRISFFVAEESGTPVGMCSLSTAFSTYAGGKALGFSPLWHDDKRGEQGACRPDKPPAYVRRSWHSSA
jgi:hypothetical protein